MLGVCYGLVPFVPAHWWLIDPLLFVAGAGQSFFTPLLGALALGLVGHAALNKTMGMNQGWNHAGNIAAAVRAMILVSLFSITSVFYAVTAVSVLAAASVFLIRTDELDERRASGVTTDGDGKSHPVGLLHLFRDRRVVILFAATVLFHLANAPVMPLVALYVKHLQGSDLQVAAVVLVAQAVMIPVALLTGWLCDRWGRKPVFAIGFVGLAAAHLPLLADDRSGSVGGPAGAGRHRGWDLRCGYRGDVRRPHTRQRAIQRPLRPDRHGPIGRRVIGPLGSGFLVQHLGFNVAFYVFAGIAAVAALLFVFFMPETRPDVLRKAPQRWAGPSGRSLNGLIRWAVQVEGLLKLRGDNV